MATLDPKIAHLLLLTFKSQHQPSRLRRMGFVAAGILTSGSVDGDAKGPAKALIQRLWHAVLRGSTAPAVQHGQVQSMQAAAQQRLQASQKRVRQMFHKSAQALEAGLALAEERRMWKRHALLLVDSAQLSLMFVR